MSPANDHAAWRRRFAFSIVFMIALNFVPFWLTWGAYGGDGYECVGLPFTFWKYGGLTGQVHVLPQWFLADVVVALIGAKLLADLTRGGLLKGVHRLRTWGTPWAD